jgi:hypothetical protein
MKTASLVKSLIVSLLLIAGWNLKAQDTLLFEDFETNGQGSRYTASQPFNDGTSDHWNRTDGSDISNTSGAYSNFNGTFFWAAEDTDDTGTNGGNGNDEQTLEITGIVITGYTNLQFSGLFGAGNESAAGSSAYDAADYIRVEYQIDGGGYQNLIWFSYLNGGDASNEPLGLDADFDGNADSASDLLGTALQTYSANITGTGATLDIRISVYMDSGNEEIAFDNLVVEGDILSGPALIITQSGGSIDVEEGGATDTFDIELNSQPTTDVIVNLSTTAPSQITFDTTTLTFTMANWNTPQTVTVTAVDDFDVEGAHTGSIDLSTSSGDANYNGLSDSFNANITDNESAPTPVLVINEVMQNPSAVNDSDGEYFEIYNPGASPVNIEGWTISDAGSESHTINNGGPLEVPAMGFLVLGINSDFASNGGVTVDYEYTGINLANGDDELILTDTGSNEIDRVEWDGGTNWPDPTGASMELSDPNLDNNVGSNWATATSTFGNGDSGTPGATNGSPISDTTPPSIVGRFPADDALDAPPATPTLAIYFDEDVQAGTGDITLHLASDDSLVGTFDVTSAVSFGGQAAQFKTTGDLTPGAEYYVNIPAGAIRDTASTPNDFAGITDKTTWSFTVATGDFASKTASGTIQIGNSGPGGTDEMYAQNTGSTGDPNDEYSLAEFSFSFTDFGGSTVTDITAVSLELTVNDRTFSSAGDIVVLFTTDSLADLSGTTSYDTLSYVAAESVNYGIDATNDFTDDPVLASSGATYRFAANTGGGLKETFTLDLSQIEADIISAINNGDSFHLIVAAPGTGGANATFSGNGNSFDPGDPSLIISAVTGGGNPKAVNITESGGSTDVTEDGATDTYSVVLNAAPSDTVTVTIDDSDLEVSASPTTLTFTTGDWDVAQTVTVSAIDDSDFESSVHVGTITHSVSSSDTGYDQISVDSVTVNVTDNDAATIPNIFINEVDADTAGTDTAEFVELYDGGAGNASLDGLVLVFFNGSNGLSYAAFDLDGESTDANGFFVLGNSAVSQADVTFSDGLLQNGEDGVALYVADATDFPNNTPATSTNIVDALVYETDSDTDSGLPAAFGISGVIDENSNGAKDDQSNSRFPDGGTRLDTSTYVAQTPTPGASNSPLDPPDILLSVNPSSFSEDAGNSAATLTVTLSEEPAVYPLVVSLSSDDIGEVEVAAPGTVTFMNVTDFNSGLDIALNAVSDGVIDSDQVVTITATGADYDDGTVDVTVTNVDQPATDGPIYISQYYQNSFEAWIEICNTSGSPVSLSGYNLAIWSLDGANPEGWKTDTGTAPNVIDLSILTVPANGTVLIRGFLTSAPTYAVADVDLTATFSEMPSLTGGESVALYDGTVTVSNVVDVVSITAADTAIGISIVRIAEGTGFDLTSGSSYADYPAIWSIVGTAPNYTDSISSVDNASNSDNIYLGFCDFGTASGFDTYISGQTGAGGDGQDDDKNGDGIDNKTSYAFDLQNDGTTTTGTGSGRPYNQLFDSAFVDNNVPATPDDITDDRFGFVFETPSNVPSDVTITVSVSSTIGGTPTTIATYTAAGGWAEANGGTVIPDPQDSNKVIIYDSQAISAASSRFMSFDVTIN